MKLKLITIILSACLFSGCANTSGEKILDDVIDGGNSSAKRRDQRAPNRVIDPVKEMEKDAVAGIMTATLRGILSLFSSDDN